MLYTFDSIASSHAKKQCLKQGDMPGGGRRRKSNKPVDTQKFYDLLEVDFFLRAELGGSFFSS